MIGGFVSSELLVTLVMSILYYQLRKVSDQKNNKKHIVVNEGDS